MSLVSLVVATYGRCDDMDRLLASLAAQTRRQFEVIVVDQNPDNRLLALIGRALEQGLVVQHLRLNTPNLSAARNAGVRSASGNIVAFPDDDCWYEPDVIERVLDAFEAHAEWQGLVARWVEQSAGRALASEGTLLLAAEWRNFKGRDASSITLFFRRAVFDQIGEFDPEMGVGQWFGAGEETDFMLRAVTAGVAIAYAPSIRLHHAFGAGPVLPLKRQLTAVRQRARGTGAIFAKHGLSAWVVLRGVCAPLVKPWLRAGRGRGVAIGLAQTLGTLEGWLCWSRRRRKGDGA